MAEIELVHVILDGVEIAITRIDRGAFLYPFIEIRRADREAVAIQQSRDSHRRLAAIGKTVEADPRRIDKRLLGKPVENPLMLGQDDREEGLAQGIGFALEHAEFVHAAIQIMRCKHHEATLSQPGGESLVSSVAASLRVIGDGVGRYSFQTVLANHDRPALSRLQIFGQEQNSPDRKSTRLNSSHVALSRM